MKRNKEKGVEICQLLEIRSGKGKKNSLSCDIDSLPNHHLGGEKERACRSGKTTEQVSSVD